jgi:hypothetical protein
MKSIFIRTNGGIKASSKYEVTGNIEVTGKILLKVPSYTTRS